MYLQCPLRNARLLRALFTPTCYDIALQHAPSPTLSQHLVTLAIFFLATRLFAMTSPTVPASSAIWSPKALKADINTNTTLNANGVSSS